VQNDDIFVNLFHNITRYISWRLVKLVTWKKIKIKMNDEK
jgi:hypothetical protein